MSTILELYRSLGRARFSRKICEMAPYFSTIHPQFVDLAPDYAEVTMGHTREVQNHLGTVHAIAMCNLAEIAAGIMTDVSIPADHRWIPVGMNVDYLAKATTDLRGIARGEGIDWKEPGVKEVVVTITDTKGLEVCRASIRVKVSPKS